MKGALRHHLSYFWWAYAATGLAIVLLWTSVFAKLAEPGDSEQLRITCIGGALDQAAMEEALAGALPGRTGQPLKRVTVESAPIFGPYDLDTLLRARLNGGCDLVLLEESVMEGYGLHLPSYFPALPEPWLEAHFPGAQAVRADGSIYGVRLPEGARLGAFCPDGGRFCVFPAPGSVNLAGLYGGPEGQDAAVQAIRYLMEASDVQA